MGAAEFGTSIHEADGHLVLVVWGEMDLAAVAQFEDALDQACRFDDLEIRLDLERVSFMDSSGVRAILGAGEELAARGRRLQINRFLSPAVMRLFTIAGVMDTLPFRNEQTP